MSATDHLPGRELNPWINVVGQGDALRRLEQAAGNPVHAYLFLGHRGSGSFAAALGFAGLLLSKAVAGYGPDRVSDSDPWSDSDRVSDPDGRSDSDRSPRRAMRLALAGTHPDLVIIEPEGATLRVSEAEEIIRAGLRTPVEADRKVIVVSGVDSIEENAIGKLLKVIEEPPPSAVFVLLAEEVRPEIITIASRCVTVEFGPLSQSELVEALRAEGADAERAAMAASAAGGDLGRAQLLATDDELMARAELWASIPLRLDGTGSTVCEVTEAVRDAMDRAQGPLEERQAAELDELEARVEQLGERGSGRAELLARHKRAVRRLRTDELRFGFAVLARYYRDRLLVASDHSAEQALEQLTAAVDAMIFNPNEALLLQNLFLKLPSGTGRA